MPIIKSGNVFTVGESTEAFDKLPKGTYKLNYSDRSGFYLTSVEDFKLPNKIYGDTTFSNRVLTAFNTKSRNLGIALTGLKGSGKTILAKKISIDSNLPVIIIESPYAGPEFLNFISSTSLGNCVIFFDEFEKVYSENEEDILPLFDGVYNTHHLLLITSNSPNLNEFLTNRPSRILYNKHYSSLEDDIINEIIDDLLEYKEYKEELISVLRMVSDVSFDILMSLISEINLHKESPKICANYMYLTMEEHKINIYQDCSKFGGGEFYMDYFYLDMNEGDNQYGLYIYDSKESYEAKRRNEYVQIPFILIWKALKENKGKLDIDGHSLIFKKQKKFNSIVF